MTQYDGSIKIGTKIDISGIEKGYKEMSEAMSDVAQELNDIVSGSNKSADSISKSAKKEAESVEDLNKSLTDVSKGIDELNDKKIDIKIERHDDVPEAKDIEEPRIEQTSAESLKYNEDAIRFIEEYAAKSEESAKKTKTTLLSLISEAKKGLKELSSQGFGPGDEEYDYAAQKLTEYNRELQVYTKGITESVQKEIFGLDSIEGKIADVNQKIAELSQMGFGIESSEMQEQVKLRAELLETEKKIYAEASKTDSQRRAESERQEAAQRKIAEQAERNLQKENARIQKEAETEAKLQAKEAERQAKIEAEAAEEQRLSKIRENAVIGNQHIVETIERRKQLLKEISDLEKAGIGVGYQQYDSAIQSLARADKEIKEYSNSIQQTKEDYKKLGDTAKKSFDKVNKTVKKTNGFLSTMASRFKGLVLSLLIFNQISKAFNAMISGMKEGMNNLAQYSDDTNKALSMLMSRSTYLKNSLATAFSPIVETITPILVSFIDLLGEAAAKVSELFSALIGKETFTKAIKVQQNYADSLKNTASSTKKAGKETEKALAPFDDLRQIQFQEAKEQEEVKPGELTPAEMFETDDVSEGMNAFADSLKMIGDTLASVFDSIKNKAIELKDIFKSGFWDGLGNYKPRLEELKTDLQKIGTYIRDIFTDADVMAATDRFVNSFVYMVGTFVGSLTSIGLTIATNIVGGIESYLSGNTERIKSWLVRMFDIGTEINTIFSNFFIAFADVFSVFASQTAQDITGSVIQIFSDIFGGILEITGKFIRDVLDTILTPFTENKEKIKKAISGTLEPIKTVVNSIADTVRRLVDGLVKLYDQHIHPLFMSLKEGLTEIFGKLLDGYNQYIVPVLNKLAEKFQEVMEGPVGDAIDSAIEFLGKLFDAVRKLWEEILQPFIAWIADNIMPIIAPVIEGIGTAALDMFAGIAEVVGLVFEVLGGLIDFIVGVFTGNWQMAWQSVARIFQGVWNAMVSIVKTVGKVISDLINGIIKGVQKAIEAINKLLGKQKDASKNSQNSSGRSGESYSGASYSGRSRSYLPPVFESLPYNPPALAMGTVVPPNREFMAVLGDNKREPEVVSPISTMKQAFIEALSESGISNNKQSDRPIYLQIDGKTFARLIDPYTEAEKTRIGVRMVTQGG